MDIEHKEKMTDVWHQRDDWTYINEGALCRAFFDNDGNMLIVFQLVNWQTKWSMIVDYVKVVEW
jgi:hypothetical protein